jgi:hypothetical protein
MKATSAIPTPAMTQFRDDLAKLLGKYTGHLQGDAMLALAAYLTGQIVAFQDQRKMSPEQAMRLVTANLQLGNDAAVADLMSAGGTVQ